MAECFWIDENESEPNFEYLKLKLAEETGEVFEKWAKNLRGDGNFSDMDVIKELSDVVFVCEALAQYYGYTLEDLAQLGYEKTSDRIARGVVKGSGDDR